MSEAANWSTDEVEVGLIRRAEGNKPGSELCTEIDASKHRFPFCVVFTPLPMLTWYVPASLCCVLPASVACCLPCCNTHRVLQHCSPV